MHSEICRALSALLLRVLKTLKERRTFEGYEARALAGAGALQKKMFNPTQDPCQNVGIGPIHRVATPSHLVILSYIRVRMFMPLLSK